MPGPYYGIDTYNWNDEPLGGGAGYWKNIYDPAQFNFPKQSPTISVATWFRDSSKLDVDNIIALQTALNTQKNNFANPPVPGTTYYLICYFQDDTVGGFTEPELDFASLTSSLDIPGNTILFGYCGWCDQVGDNSKGAHLYTSVPLPFPIFKVSGPYVRIFGLRIEGQDPTQPWLNYPNLSYCAIQGGNHDLEIFNCDISYFNYAAIYVEKSPLTSQNLTNISIHHNKIHHVPNGYGIGIGRCYTLIYANIFDYNMNSIAGTGSTVTSIIIFYNIILPNATGEAIVMYRDPRSKYYAGNSMFIRDNTFWIRSYSAISIKGVPANNITISGNRFAEPADHTSLPLYYNDNDAVILSSGMTNIHITNNNYWEYVNSQGTTPNGPYGIETYTGWNNTPLGGGRGYNNIINPSSTGVTVVPLDNIDWSPLVNALQAAASPTGNKIIFIVDNTVGKTGIDLTKYIDPNNQYLPGHISPNVVVIPAGTTLCSDRGNGNSLGALLYTTVDYKEEFHNPLIRVIGPNVRITGLRIEGTNQYYLPPPSGILDTACGITLKMEGPSSNTSPADYNFIVDNCELFGWSYAAIRISGNHCSPPPPDNVIPPLAPFPQLRGIHIHHNYIHHNQFTPDINHSYGYGMTMDNCDVLIEANIFDYNKHSIASTGFFQTSYHAQYNFQLTNALIHAWDVHEYPRGSSAVFSGHRTEINNNTFWILVTASIGIGMTPCPYPLPGGYPQYNNVQYPVNFPPCQKIHNNFFAQKPWVHIGTSPPNPTNPATQHWDDHNMIINPATGTHPYIWFPNIIGNTNISANNNLYIDVVDP